MLIKEYEGHKPNLHPTVRVAENAVIVGKATLEADVNVWYSAVIRADGDEIFIGARSNIQDAAVLHCDSGSPIHLGENVVVGPTGLSSTPARWGTTASSAWVRRSSPAARSAAAASSALALWWRGT